LEVSGWGGQTNGKGKDKDKDKGKKVVGEDWGITEGVREVVRMCLRVEAVERPDVDELIGLVEGVIERVVGWWAVG